MVFLLRLDADVDWRVCEYWIPVPTQKIRSLCVRQRAAHQIDNEN